MRNVFYLDYSATADTIQNQLEQQGYNITFTQAIKLQEFKDAADRLYFSNYIKEDTYDEILKKLTKEVKAIIKKL